MITGLRNTMIVRAGEDGQVKPEALSHREHDDGPHMSPQLAARPGRPRRSQRLAALPEDAAAGLPVLIFGVQQ